MHYYLVQSASSCQATYPWLRDFAAMCKCQRCRSIDREMRRHPIDICLRAKPGPSAITCTDDVYVNIGRRLFLQLFEPELSEVCQLGEVRGPDGTVLEEFRSFVSPNPLVIRGGPKSRSDRCGFCGMFLYIPALEYYVLEQDLSGRNIYEAFVEGEGLVLSAEFRSRIERGRWKGIGITKIPVLDEPQDGIDEFPDDYL